MSGALQASLGFTAANRERTISSALSSCRSRNRPSSRLGGIRLGRCFFLGPGGVGLLSRFIGFASWFLLALGLADGSAGSLVLR